MAQTHPLSAGGFESFLTWKIPDPLSPVLVNSKLDVSYV